jgi:MFS family permease
LADPIYLLGRLQSAANGIPLLIVGRIVAGLSVGLASAIVPVYQAEIAPKEVRGRVVSLQQWAITWGILIQYFIQYGASFSGGGPKNPKQGTAAFRIPWAVQMFPAIILLIGLFFFPKSPRWLAAQDRWDEAIQVLADLHCGGDINHPRILAEYREIEEALTFERELARSSFKTLTQHRILKRIALGMSIQMWSQLCGMNVMSAYLNSHRDIGKGLWLVRVVTD